MATTIFSKQRGQVALFLDPAVPAMTSLQLENWGGMQAMKSMITRVAVSSSCNFQVLHTLGGDAFLYVFGDRVGQIIVSGLSFDSVCDDPGGLIGVERVAAYYNSNRLAARKLPLRMTLGSSLTFRMYLSGAGIDVEEVSSRIWRFSFVLLEVPEPLPRLSGGSAARSSSATAAASAAAAMPLFGSLPKLASSAADPGGYDPEQAVVPVSAGDGYSAYSTGPSLSVRGFSLP